MTSVDCPVCKATGLTGAGPEPHLHQGNVTTCGNCGGTGKVEDGQVAEAPVEAAPAVEEASSSENVAPESSSEVSTVPTEMITPEMRAAGIDETTPLKTREEMVAELGEEKVAEIEADALNNGNVVEEVTVDNTDTAAVTEGATLEAAPTEEVLG